MALVSTTQTTDNLDVEIELVKNVTVLTGNTVSRGDLVRYDDIATTKVVGFLTTKTPLTIMLEDVDASGGDAVGKALRLGKVKASEVNFGTGTDAEVREALDALGIYLID